MPLTGFYLCGYIWCPWGLVWMQPFGKHHHDVGCFMHTFPPFYFIQWYAYHVYLCHLLALYASLQAYFYVHAWVLLASVSSILQHNEDMDIWSKHSFVPHEHHPFFACFLVCLFTCLLSIFLVCLIAHLFISLFLHLPCLSCLSILCLFHVLFASFPAITCLPVSCLCLCTYTHSVRMYGARAQSPKRKQKGRGCEHVDISQVVMFSRFRGFSLSHLVMYSKSSISV